MLPATPLHTWDVTPGEAIAIQQRLAPLVQTSGITAEQVRTVAGVDASYTTVGRAAIVVLSYPALELIEQVTAVRESVFPYVPGLLTFREGPVVLDALAKLTTLPDVLIFDGQGIAHPRRMGIAAHMGVYLDRPTIGCAKSRLYGTFPEPEVTAGAESPLMAQGQVIGTVLRSKTRTRPLFISIGNKIDLANAVTIVKGCLRGYRLPETTRRADHLAGEGMKGYHE